jgi:hypothetical protein
MGPRACSRCKVFKPLTEFKPKGQKGWQGYCVTCQATYRREHYQANKRAYVERAKRSSAARREAVRMLIQKAKEGKTCADCLKAYQPWVLQFDHFRGIG